MKNRWDPASGVLIHGAKASVRVGVVGFSLFLCHSATPRSSSSSSHSTRPAAPPPPQQSPLTHPHLLVPGPDIAALLRRRLVNTRDTLQFNVSDSVCRGWKASGAERGPQTIRRISTHPSVHKLNRPSLNPFSGDFSLS